MKRSISLTGKTTINLSLILALSTVAYAQSTSAFNGIGCPGKSWNLNTVARFASTSNVSDGNQKMVCSHRGSHDWMNNHPDVPENSATAVGLAFIDYPCVELDAGSLVNGHVAMYHDLMTYRSTSSVTSSNGTQISGPYVFSPNGNPDYTSTPVTNIESYQQTAAVLRPMRKDGNSSNPIGLYDIDTLVSDVATCDSTTGLVVLDIRDKNTFVRVVNVLVGHSKKNSSPLSPAIDPRHFLVKFKTWKIVNNTPGGLGESQFLGYITRLRNAGIGILPTILQGTVGQKDLATRVGWFITATQVIYSACSKYNGFCPEEFSISQGATDPLNNLKPTLFIPYFIPPNFGVFDPSSYSGYPAYNAAWNSWRTRYGSVAQIWGWIPVPEVHQAGNVPNLSNLNPAYAYNTGDNKVNGYFNYATGTCCRIADTHYTAELTRDYLTDTIGANVITIDGPADTYFSSGKAVLSQSFFR